MRGTFGPYMSASNRPTRAPSSASASARLTVTVVLPTPPLPLATTRMRDTPLIGGGIRDVSFLQPGPLYTTGCELTTYCTCATHNRLVPYQVRACCLSSTTRLPAGGRAPALYLCLVQRTA